PRSGPYTLSLHDALPILRLEGGRYRFTTEPNLNKVILEREGAIGDDRIEALLREAIARVAPSTPELRVEPRVAESADLPDNQQRSEEHTSELQSRGHLVC